MNRKTTETPPPYRVLISSMNHPLSATASRGAGKVIFAQEAVTRICEGAGPGATSGHFKSVFISQISEAVPCGG